MNCALPTAPVLGLDKAGSGLTVTPPEAFGFLDGPPNRITVDQSQLKLQPGRTLSLVGGDLDLSGGASASTAAGTVNLVSWLRLAKPGFPTGRSTLPNWGAFG